MQSINQEMAGYRIPAYVEEILTQNYCSNFMRMSILKKDGEYSFSYKPGNYSRVDAKGMKIYDKLLLIRNLIRMTENSADHLIAAETYLLEPELVYSRHGQLDADNLRLMYYPDVKKLDLRYKIVLFADRIMDREIREEREMTERLREAAEPGDINRIKLFLDKNILRLESRMSETDSYRLKYH